MRVLRSPVTQFLLIGMLTVVGIAVGSNYLADRAALDEAVEEAQRTTEVLATSVAEPALPRTSRAGARPGGADQIRRRGLPLLLGRPGRSSDRSRTPSGMIVYSDVTCADRHDVRRSTATAERVLSEGGSGSQYADPTATRRAAQRRR